MIKFFLNIYMVNLLHPHGRHYWSELNPPHYKIQRLDLPLASADWFEGTCAGFQLYNHRSALHKGLLDKPKQMG